MRALRPLARPRPPAPLGWLALLAATFLVAAGCLAGRTAGLGRGEHGAGAGPAQAVVLVTLDGLLPETYLRPEAHGLRVPTLRRLVAEGATSDGMLSVFPSLTYPAHATLATGVSPARHGIVTNRGRDPLEKNLDGWRWYAADLRATPLWIVAERAGLHTALVGWPVTVGASATWVLPEVWRARTAEDVKLLHALTTPQLAAALSAGKPDAWQTFQPDGHNDELAVAAAGWLLRTQRPSLVFVHLSAVDEAQHKSGLWSTATVAAIEATDARLAQLVEATRAAGTFARTAFVVASDHGFAPVTRAVRPGALLREAGLVCLDDKQKIISARASIVTSGGQAYVYLEDGAATTAETVRRAVDAQAKRANSGLGKLYDQAAIRAAGGDPAAFLAFEAEPSTTFVHGYAGPYEVPSTTTRANHGYDPTRPTMRAALLVAGPGIPHGSIADARLIDVAPTMAALLGLKLPDVEGRDLFRSPRTTD